MIAQAPSCLNVYTAGALGPCEHSVPLLCVCRCVWPCVVTAVGNHPFLRPLCSLILYNISCQSLLVPQLAAAGAVRALLALVQPAQASTTLAVGTWCHFSQGAVVALPSFDSVSRWCGRGLAGAASAGVVNDNLLLATVDALVLQLCARAMSNLATYRAGSLSLVESRSPSLIADLWNLFSPSLQVWLGYQHVLGSRTRHVVVAGRVGRLGRLRSCWSCFNSNYCRISDAVASYCCSWQSVLCSWTLFNVCRLPHYLPHVGNAGGVILISHVIASALRALRHCVDDEDATMYHTWVIRRLALSLAALTCFSHTLSRVVRGGGVTALVRTVELLVNGDKKAKEVPPGGF